GPVISTGPHLSVATGLSWFQGKQLPICAAKSKQSGGTTGKIRSTRLDGISDIAIRPPRLQQISQKVPGEIARNAAPIFHRRDARSKIAIAISRMLHGENLCSRCGR